MRVHSFRARHRRATHSPTADGSRLRAAITAMFALAGVLPRAGRSGSPTSAARSAPTMPRSAWRCYASRWAPWPRCAPPEPWSSASEPGRTTTLAGRSWSPERGPPRPGGLGDGPRGRAAGVRRGDRDPQRRHEQRRGTSRGRPGQVGAAVPACGVQLRRARGSLVGGVVAGDARAADAPARRGCRRGWLTVAASPVTLLAGDPRRPTGRPASGPPRTHPLGGVRTTIVTLGVIAGCTAFAEGALSDWAALHLAEDLDAPRCWAAAGTPGSRSRWPAAGWPGTALLRRWGETRMLIVGSLLAAGGMLAAALSPSMAVALGGLVVVGLGLANVFPRRHRPSRGPRRVARRRRWHRPWGTAGCCSGRP